MNRIVNIETYPTYNNKINFVGLLINEKKFNLLQNVFILYNEKMYQSKIVGVELPPVDNPEYIYKVEIPEQFIEDNENRIELICDNIFSSIMEAKESAIKDLQRKYELNKEHIERFFKQYE